MTKWDKEYIKLCKKVLKDGVEVENRTGINSVKLDGYYFELDLEKEFPVLTTKKLYFRQAILEMLWIYQAQSNDVRWLQERDVHIWDEWQIDKDGKWKATQMILDENEKLVKKDIVRDFGQDLAYTIGTAYGFIAGRYKFMENLINKLKTNPTDRRMVYTLWQDEFMKTAVLPSCVWSTEWNVTGDKLNLWVHQRSADIPLGLPFNVTQYAVLANLIAHCTGLKLGKMRYSINDPHVYVNQIDGIKEQIIRYETEGDLPAPKLWINPEVKDFFKIDNSKELKDIKIEGYQDLGPISFPLAQ
ncbi:MAG: thymidylate synthase [Bacilli bacterium]|nr:thymidylate synthase [Bacilli bacterium]MDD4795451.1 thymidylate synthase [Bacilli bacterium]